MPPWEIFRNSGASVGIETLYAAARHALSRLTISSEY
jgi:hypothetical protein